MQKRAIIFFLVFLLINSKSIVAQHNNEVSEINRISHPGVYKMPKQNNLELLNAEKSLRKPGRPNHFAVPIEIEMDFLDKAYWKDDGLWSVGKIIIYSESAYSLNFGFTEFSLPESASLHLYNKDKSDIKGPFSGTVFNEYNELWTPIVRGDWVVIEVKLYSREKNQLNLKLTYVNHDFAGFLGIAKSGSCNLDVACGEADGFPQVDAYRDVIQSVGAYHINGISTCSGALVNNTSNDCTPYFLTANHCGINANNTGSVVVYWNYQNSTCRPPFSTASALSGDGMLDDFNTGAILRARSAITDFTLIELRDPVSETANAYAAGINAEYPIGGNAVCIHHPGVEEKRITFDFDSLVLHPPDTNYVQVQNWEIGTTEGGSSGSPLFDQNRMIIGQLFGGFASCTSITEDWYGRTAISWERGTDPAERLIDWLDPLSTGQRIIPGRWCSSVLTSPTDRIKVCADNEVEYSVPIVALGAFTGPVSFAIEEAPPGLIVKFSENMAALGDTIFVNISDFRMLQEGQNILTISASDGSESAILNIIIEVFTDIPAIASLLNPFNNSTDQATNIRLTWEEIANASYLLEISNKEDFTGDYFERVSSTQTSYFVRNLDISAQYFWRVKSFNVCGEAEDWSEIFSFQTGKTFCVSDFAKDLPIIIDDFFPNTISSEIKIEKSGKISSVSIPKIKGVHTWVDDLTFILISPSGTRVILLEEECGSDENFDMAFSDFIGSPFQCPMNTFAWHLPQETLSSIIGEEGQGSWTLEIIDDYLFDGGELQEWEIEICFIDSGPVGMQLKQSEYDMCQNGEITIEVFFGELFSQSINFDILSPIEGIEFAWTDDIINPNESRVILCYATDGELTGKFIIGFVANDGAYYDTLYFDFTIKPTPKSGSLIAPGNGQDWFDEEIIFLWETGPYTYTQNLHLYPVNSPGEIEIIENIPISEPSFLILEAGMLRNYAWFVEFINECGVAISDTFTFILPLNSTQNLHLSGIKIYPNPASQILNIESQVELQLKHVIFYDISGKEVLRSSTLPNHNEVHRINVSVLKTGIYTLVLSGDNVHQTAKLSVVQR
jgi:subtilisin-like proprotein convertase family protein